MTSNDIIGVDDGSQIVARGDPYAGEVAATVESIMQLRNHSNPHRLVWQSKVTHCTLVTVHHGCMMSEAD